LVKKNVEAFGEKMSKVCKNIRAWKDQRNAKLAKLGETILKLGKIFTNVRLLGICNILLKF
jgi:hypothetical protein